MGHCNAAHDIPASIQIAKMYTSRAAVVDVILQPVPARAVTAPAATPMKPPMAGVGGPGSIVRTGSGSGSASVSGSVTDSSPVSVTGMGYTPFNGYLVTSTNTTPL